MNSCHTSKIPVAIMVCHSFQFHIIFTKGMHAVNIQAIQVATCATGGIIWLVQGIEHTLGVLLLYIVNRNETLKIYKHGNLSQTHTPLHSYLLLVHALYTCTKLMRSQTHPILFISLM